MRMFMLTLALLPLANGLCGAAELSVTPAEYRALAIKNNPGLAQARLAERASEHTVKAALAAYFPKLSAGALAANTNILPNSALSMALLPAAANAESTVSAAFITAQQPLYAGGRIVNGTRLARTGRDAAHEQMRLKEQEVTANAEKKYRTLQVLAEKKNTLAAYANLLNALSAQVDQAFAGGLVTKTDVLRVNLKKAEVALNRCSLEKATALAEEDFRLYAGIEPGTPLSLPAAVENIDVPAEKRDALFKALAQRPEYKLLEAGAKAAELQTAMKRGEYLPAIGIGAQLFRVDYYHGGDQRYQNSAAFGMVSVPLNWWEGAHSVKVMSLKRDEARARLKELGDYLLVDLESKLKDYEDAYEHVKLAELAVEEAKANHSEKEDGYKNGTEKLSDLLEALALEQDSLDGLTSSRSEYFIKHTEFLLAAGSTFPGETPGRTNDAKEKSGD